MTNVSSGGAQSLGAARGSIQIDTSDLQRIQALTQQVGQVVARNLGQIDADLSLGVNSSDVLEFNGTSLQNLLSVSDTSTIDLTLAADVLSADIVSASITNALISNSAAIAYSKLALTGSIVNADLVNVAEATFKGRAAGAGTGAPQDLTATQATAILNAFVGDSGSGGTKGLAPAPAAGDTAAGKFLFADGTWKTPPGSGDVVGPASATDNGFVRFDGTTGKLIKDSPATISNADVASNAAIAYSKLAALTASRALVSDGSGVVSAATTTATEIGYVNGVTSAIQTQLNGKLPTTITTTGDLIYSSSGTTAARLGIGNAGQGLRVVSGLPAWGYAAYRSVTTTDSPTTADDVLACSGSAFTITLPTAVGCAGKVFSILHNGSNFVAYTLNTTSGQTIGGYASGAIVLYTNGETFRIVSDGANWQILEHQATTPLVAYTPGNQGFGTFSSVNFYWRRVGNQLEMRGTVVNGTVTASQARLNFPDVNLAALSGIGTFFFCGFAYMPATSNSGWCNNEPVWVDAGNNYVTYQAVSNSTRTNGTGSGVSNTGTTQSLDVRIPIQGWIP